MASGDNLHLLYAGHVYEPHADAMAALVDATRELTNVKVTYLTRPEAMNGLMGRVGARWLPHGQALATMQTADVFVVVLGGRVSRLNERPLPSGFRLGRLRTPSSVVLRGRGSESDEVMGCFPSKLIDYLSIGRPILAIVPGGCFVDRLVSETGCGLVVRRHDAASIRHAVEAMRDPELRSRMTEAGRQVLWQLRGEAWMPRLLERLRDGPANRSSLPRFPNPLIEATQPSEFDRMKPLHPSCVGTVASRGLSPARTSAQAETCGSSLASITETAVVTEPCW